MRVTFFAVVVVMSALGLGAAGCPPPPPPIVDAGVEPDAGVLGQEGDPCFSPTSTNNCALGLACAALKDADAGVFACATPGAQGADCFFNHNHSEPDPPDDPCGNGLLCGGEDKCALKGDLFAPCASPADCASLNCGVLTDGSGTVCVVNDCAAGCGAGKVCRQSACGLTCVDPPGNGAQCIIPSTDPCGTITLDCSDGLECYVGDPATGVTCAVPGGEGDSCNLTTTQDGCQAGLFCDNGNNTCKRQ